MHGLPDLRDRLPRTAALLEQGRAEGLHPGAQICVMRNGETVVDAAIGEDRPGHALTREHLLLWLSATKPVTAVALMQQIEAGRLALDTPVAEIIPTFGANGKEHLTVFHALTHTAGIRGADLGWKPQSWDEALAKIYEVRPEPRWEAGQKAGYHIDSLSYVQGELVRRLSGLEFADYIRARVFEPIGAQTSFIGMPDSARHALDPLVARLWDTSGAHAVEKAEYRDPRVTALARPGGNGRGPARELARFYADLLSPAPVLLSRASVDTMTHRWREGLHDHTFRHVMDWGLGFALSSNRHGAETVPYGFGRRCSDATFGHCGNQCSAAFGDPAHHLAVVLIFTGQPGEPRHQARMRDALTAVYEDLGL